jgi:hypothetical protein
MPNDISERATLAQTSSDLKEVDNSEIISVRREGNEIRTHINFPTSCITVLGEGPVNLSLTYNVSVDARSQVLNDDRVVKNTENNTTIANGDSVINAIGGILSGLFNI